jgi:hypothetical protein
MENGYKVVVNDLKGNTFSKRYTIYQNIGFSDLKIVVIDDNGNILGVQG